MNEHALRPDWRGYFSAVATPFNRDLSIDWSGFESLIRWLLLERMHGFVVAGTTGEWNTLSQAERCKLFEVARHSIPASRPLLAGCSALYVEETFRYARLAEDLQMDGILLTVPPYACPTEEESLEFFHQVARRTRLPIIAYNWPNGTGVDFSLELIRKIARIDTVVGLKHSTPDRAHFIEVLQAMHAKMLVFGVMPGEGGLETLLSIGGAGCIGAAGVLGYRQPGFFDAVWARDLERARLLGSFDEKLMGALFDRFRGKFGHAVSTFKYLLALQDLPAGPVRAPLLELSKNNQAKVRSLVRELGLFDHV